ncbi:MAG: YdcF family protein, partial [Burkholderiaceae bacterium]
LLGLGLGRARPRRARVLVAVGVGGLLLLSLPVVSSALLLAASDPRVLDPAAAGAAQAIVILSGGLRRDAPEYGGDTLGRLALERTRYGAKVARETGLPVLVTGGAYGPTRPEAHVMRDVLEREYGVTVRWVEDRARTTRENAQFTARVLRPLGIERVVLVVHAFDVPRARLEFERAGLNVVPAPTMIPRLAAAGIADFLPSAAALQSSYYALYELFGYAGVRLGL